MTTPPPLAFIYDRNATRSSAYLDMRLDGCRNYATGKGWTIADHWVDRGDDALTDTRPQLSALLEIMRMEARIRPVICLVHSWGRLAADPEQRIAFQQRVAQAGGFCATTFDESDERAHAALVGRGDA
ncbi:recombinase family protein [Streptomyces albofaciens JCM 4342]|uniref:recombinase family protein n=1 Tax=Streptomyces albofaciens TaxID=66866 RepID=UPI000B24F4B1|nr:recombinase family protein [Streptomyces albofaciens]KAA6221716.1 recombinase family protein [Streptomyces albofaciens JCM 4342]